MSQPASGQRPLSVVGIVASPHGGGSTAAAVQSMLSVCREGGAEVNLFDLSTAESPTAIDAVSAADAVVFGSPTYRASHTSLLGGFLERLERGASWETKAPLKGKAVAIVMTGAAREHFLATENLRTILASFFAAQVLSPSVFLTADGFNDKRPTAETDDLLSLHAGALLELATATRDSKHLSALEPLV